MYTSRAFQNGIASQNILIFVGTSSVDVKKYILEKCKKKEEKNCKFYCIFTSTWFIWKLLQSRCVANIQFLTGLQPDFHQFLLIGSVSKVGLKRGHFWTIHGQYIFT